MKKYFLALSALLLLCACASDPNDATTPAIPNQQPQPGSLEAFQDAVGATVYAQLLAIDFPIHTGQNPPNLDFFLKIDDGKILQTNAPQYPIGTFTGDLYTAFLNQRDNGFTLNYESEHYLTIGEPHLETGQDFVFSRAFGHGDKFTVCASMSIFIGIEEQATAIHILSGRLTAEGVADLKLMEYVTHNQDGNPEIMEGGQYRVYGDSDGLARFETF